MEWTIAAASQGDDPITYGGAPVGAEHEWYRSPVNAHPLSVLPERVRETVLGAMTPEGDLPVAVNTSLDPFCKEAYDHLEKHYTGTHGDELFEAITDPKHLRVVRQLVGIGEGVGILHSEDDGSPKERLVGSWMPGMLRELGSRGRKNPQAFSYDGVLSQGNGVLTLVEDASQHADLLQKLLNVPEERMVKLDKKITMDIDTVMVILSNPDLDAQLNKHADAIEADPLKALRRRLDKHEFRYLTDLSLETDLIHREFAGKRDIWTETEPEAIDKLVRAPVTVYGSEFAPHAIEAAALYSIVTRLATGDLPDELDLVDKALLLDRGFHVENNERVSIDEFDLDEGAHDGVSGIPVTYTKDELAALAQDHAIVLPHDVLDALVENLDDDPVFSDHEVEEFKNRFEVVSDYLDQRLAADVIAAMLRDKRVAESEVREYVEAVYEWDDAEAEGVDAEDADYDPLRLKVFETEHLGLSADDYSTSTPKKAVKEFRRTKVINPLNKYAWDSRGADFHVEELPLKEAPVLKSLLGTYDWEAVENEYENLDARQWRDPAGGTETEAVKEQTLANMVEMFGYSDESAARASAHVMDAWMDDRIDAALERAAVDSGA
jgi:predicted Ser/Thr protein kinase